MELKDYKKLINKASSKDELQQIVYNCFLENGQSIISKKYNQVLKLAIMREIELGL